jgi:hypothetical protein
VILHLNPSQRRAVLRALDSRLSTIAERRRTGTLKPRDPDDVVLVDDLRRQLVEAGRTEMRRAAEADQ